MREIKFRGKVLKSSNWAYGDLHILSDMPPYRVGVIKYDDQYHGCWEVSCYYHFLPKRMEVIGNIYDNPELLEGGVK